MRTFHFSKFRSSDRYFRIVLLSACLIFSLLLAEYPHAGSFRPEQIKSAMLIKFTNFITWPEKAFEKTPGTFVVGVFGAPEIFRLLEPLSGKMIQGRKLSVIELSDLDPDQTLHLLYIESSLIDQTANFFRGANYPATLTVSDSEDFLKAGGILRFVMKNDGHVGFAVNRTAQLRSGLTFSSTLLRLATILRYDNDGGVIQ